MNLKIKVNPVFPATVEGAGGIGVSKSGMVWTVQPSWDDLAVETDLSDASQRQLWVYNPTAEVYTRLSVEYLLDNLPAGPEGDQGPVAGIKQTYSTTTTDSDPGAGTFRLNNATIASVTAGYFDNVDADGVTVSTILDTWDDSTTTTKGSLRIEKQDDSSVWAVFTVTGSVTDGTGYRKLTLTYVATGGTFTNGDTFRIAFSRTGDKGTDGAGTGDVSAASTFGTDNVVVRSDGTSKGVQSSGVSIDDSNNVSGIATLTTSGNIELGHATENTLSASSGVLSIEGVQLLKANGNQTITGGFVLTPYDNGTKSSGTLTLDPTLGNYQRVINGGAHSISPPAATNFDVVDLLYINGPSAGSLTFTAGKWRVGTVTGSTFATTARVSGASVTVTSASPGVVSWTSHGCVEGDPVWFTAAVIPTGLTASTVYYVKYVDANSFQLAATPGGTALNTSSTGTTVLGNAASQFILSVRQIYGSATYSWYALQ